MPFPTANTKRTLASALERAQAQADSIKRIAGNNLARLVAGPVAADAILALMDNLNGAVAVLRDAASTPGIAAYAQNEWGDTVDIASAFSEMVDAIAVTAQWIATNFPKDKDGYLLAETIVDGQRTQRSFSAEQTEGLRERLSALIATID